MPLTLDHIAIRVQDLRQAVADFSELGFTVQLGGTYSDGILHNALIGFADGSYFELIAPLKDVPQHRWASRDPDTHEREGLTDYALLSRALGATIDAAHGRGLRYEGPIPGGRIRPDGTRLEWQIGKPLTRDLPSLCADLTPRFLRLAEGEVRMHPNGVSSIASVALAVRDLNASVQRYRALLGHALDARRAGLPGEGVELALFPVGHTIVMLLSPTVSPHTTMHAAHAHDASSRPAFAERLRTHLESRGEGLFGVSLRTKHASQIRVLPLSLTHHAPVELVGL
ncbi:glyoxalase [Burkholderia sp. WAC0059]|uniref:VOC family protein n=1 Tax=Burkholderia sp. WAC0059 TaxID=2066022 RepID=UPI000C7EFF38|nr:VOC family protein [Burkholderia sp. WAC0059]PLZ03875.1 glyoxalase [Burkholderia sp. WAC0059]